MHRVTFALLVAASLIATVLIANRFVVAAVPVNTLPIGKQIGGFELHDYLARLTSSMSGPAKKRSW